MSMRSLGNTLAAETTSIKKLLALRVTATIIYLVIEELLGSDDYRFGQTLIVTRNLDLLTVLESLLHSVGR